MNMTPKKILSLPTYSAGTIVGLIATLLLVPGGLIMLIALALYWLADRLSTDNINDDALLTIEDYEEYGEGVDVGTPQRCDNCTFGDACLTAAGHRCDDWEAEVDVNG